MSPHDPGPRSRGPHGQGSQQRQQSGPLGGDGGDGLFEFQPPAPNDTTADTYDTGTTVVAIAAADGVAMAADRRMSLGGRFTSNKQARKLKRVHPRGVMAISGAVGPAQGVVGALRAEANLYESRRDEPMSATALAQTAGHLLRGMPVVPLLGAVDDDGPRVYELDGSGSVMADDYAAGGSGMQVAYGVLERRFDPEASLDGATEAAIAAVRAASERDTASGNGITTAQITTEGIETDEYAADGESTTGDGDTAGQGEVA